MRSPTQRLLILAIYGAGLAGIARGQVVTEFPLPRLDARVPWDIAAGPDGNLWFVEGTSNSVGRITTAGVVTEFPILNPQSTALGIAAGPDGNLWITEYAYAPAGNKIGRISTAGVITEFLIPTANSGPVGIAAGPDGNLWFTETKANAIGRMNTAGVLTGTFPLSGPGSATGIATGPDGALWFTDGNRIGRITTSGVITEFTPGADLDSLGIAAGPDGNMWFTENSRIGRIDLGSAGPCVADGTTLCLNGGRFQVRAEWLIPSQGTSGQGRAVPLTDDTGTFWFFEASSVEVVVKVLDACSLNGHSWVFAGGLTNVGVTLTVTDLQTDVAKSYTNSAGTAFQPIQDTAAFSTCP